MSAHNVGRHIAGALDIGNIAATTTKTLTAADLTNGICFVSGSTAGGAWTLTLPAASSAFKCRLLFVGNYGHQTNDLTVHVAAGFGGDADIDDSVVDAGEVGIFICDGSYWYANGSTIPEA